MNRGEILVIALARIGDLAQCFPALSDLGRWPGYSGIALLVRKDLVPVAQLHPRVSRVIPFDGDALIGALREGDNWSDQALHHLSEQMAAIDLSNISLIVNLTHTPFSGLICGMQHGIEVRGRSYVRGCGTILNGNWARYFFTLLSSRSCNAFNLVDVHREIAAGMRGALDRLQIPEGSVVFASENLRSLGGKRRIALAIGAHHPLRRWPLESWKKAAELLSDRSNGIVLLGGPGEREAGDAIAAGLGQRGLNLCGRTDLTQLTAAIDQCDLLIGHDSGLLHLAAMLNKPCLGIYLAMASVWETAPYKDDAVSIEPNIDCHPCSEAGGCRDPRCQRVIDPETVADVAIRLLDGQQPARYIRCFSRISRLDEGGWLILDGERRNGDTIRLFWRDLLPSMLNLECEGGDGRQDEYSGLDLSPEWLRSLEDLKNISIRLIRTTLAKLEKVRAQDPREIRDALAQELPGLTARYPEFGPLFELYRLECLGVDVMASGSKIENTLQAQDKFLQRIGIVQDRCSRRWMPEPRNACRSEVQMGAVG